MGLIDKISSTYYNITLAGVLGVFGELDLELWGECFADFSVFGDLVLCSERKYLAFCWNNQIRARITEAKIITQSIYHIVNL